MKREVQPARVRLAYQVAALLLALATSGCATTYNLTTGRCPTTTMLLGDFVLAGAAMGVSVLRWNDGDYAVAGVAFGASMSIALGANVSEIRGCKR